MREQREFPGVRAVFFYVFIITAGIVLVCFSACNPFYEYENPVDPDSEEYVGEEVEDTDGDGVGQYYDVDEITLVSPADGKTLDTATPTLQVYRFDPETVSRYRVHIATDGTAFDSTTVFDKDDVSSNECALPAGVLINSSVTYYWRAKAFDGEKWSDAWSEVRSFTVSPETVSVVTLTSPADAATVTDTTPLISWEALSYASNYHLMVADNDAFSSPLLDKTDVSGTGYTLSGTAPELLSNGQTYYWKVAPIDGNGVEGDFSSVWSFTIETETGISIDPDLDNPITITFSGEQTAIAYGSSMTVTATTSETVDSYQWYLDGSPISGETTASITIGATLSPGWYSLQLLVLKSDVASSDYIEFEVGEEEIALYLESTGFSLTEVIGTGETGTFDMGSTSGDSDEEPVHSVTLTRPYSISTYEVTNEQVAKVFNRALDEGWVTASTSTVQNANGNTQELLDMDDSDCEISYSGGSLVVDSGQEDHPCIEITWYGSVAFCYYLNQIEGREQTYSLSDWSCDFSKNGYRLPTEAEWEYAARGGDRSQGYTYAGSNTIDDVALYGSNSGGWTNPVGAKQANEIGTFDMSGNVWEWCNDRYDSGYYGSSPSSDPEGPASGSSRLIRGGHWGNSAYGCRVAYRNDDNPTDSYHYLGFRPLLPPGSAQ